MGNNTAIAWCDATFNPWIGCTKVSAGCTNCYAERDDSRRKWTPGGWGKGKPRKRTSPANWKQPLKWDRHAVAEGVRRRVFCASLADVFDEEVNPVWFLDLMALITQCPNLDWLLLTKRPQRMIGLAFPPNVWPGVSVEDQATADERIPVLLQIPAEVRWVSYEPALGPVMFDKGPGEYLRCPDCGYTKRDVGEQMDHRLCNGPGPGLDWIVVGGESGPSARPFDVAWARSTIQKCRTAGVACFVKQLGARPLGDKVWAQGGWCSTENPDGVYEVKLKDPKGADPAEWPADLRVREWPRAKEFKR